MGKKTALHKAAERGDSDSLQRLLDEGTYNVNEENDGCLKVCLQRERERERERGVDLLSFPSHLHTVDCVW